MIRYGLYLTNNQVRTLRKFSKDGVSVSELIRIAVSNYISKLKVERLNVSKSLSK